MQVGGQRLGTNVPYLSKIEWGGGTSFPAIGLEVMPKKGAALFFVNIDCQHVPDQLTLHAGSPVVKSAKFIANKWLRHRELSVASQFSEERQGTGAPRHGKCQLRTSGCYLCIDTSLKKIVPCTDELIQAGVAHYVIPDLGPPRRIGLVSYFPVVQVRTKDLGVGGPRIYSSMFP
jgi:hypothetical protein